MKNPIWTLLLLAFFAAACNTSSGPASAPVSGGSSPSFGQWANAFTQEWARNSPQLATRTQYFTGAEQDALEGQLTLVGEWGNAYGVGESRKRARLAARGLEQLRAFNRDSLTPAQQLDAAVIEWWLDDAVKNEEFAAHNLVFDQFNGLQLEYVSSLTQTHPVRNRRDIENYLQKLTLVAPRIDQGIVEARAADAAGIRPPRFIIDRTMQQIDGLLQQTGKANVFVATLDERIGALGSAIPPAERTGFVAAAEKTVSESVLPAYQRINAMFAEQLPRSTNDAGVWRLPRGDEFYRRALATHTTTTMTPDEIHAVGLREVARLEAEMDTLLRQLGFTAGSVKERYAQLEQSIQPKGPGDPRPQILADNVRWVRDAERRAAGLFDLRPQAPVEVQRQPAFSEKTAQANYNSPAPDGSRPGVFRLPLPGPTFELLRTRSLAYHEAVPGHHFQIGLQQEMTELPRFRRAAVFGDITAYVEGWGLYAERLADEEGWYAGDPQGRIGYLNNMLWRARRLVVDTGVHAKKWTRQQAIDYGIAPYEVERYVVYPGQACSYMIGQLKIVELREKARARRGDRFSIREFHNAVLRAANVPLSALEAAVARALP
jgi:uncharacterized protein (DUF885 family)